MNRQRWRLSGRQWSSSPLAERDVMAGRDRAVAWARAMLADPATVFLDTETTGFPPAAEVVDLAVVSADGEILLDTLVRPEAPIPASATAIHGISDQHVAHAPTWCEVHGALVDALAGRTVVIYNMDFDRRVLLGCSDRYQLSLPPARWECAMLAYADYRGDANLRTGRPRWHKLDVAARHFGYEPGGHRALTDTLACLRVVRGMAGFG